MFFHQEFVLIVTDQVSMCACVNIEMTITFKNPTRHMQMVDYVISIILVRPEL